MTDVERDWTIQVKVLIGEQIIMKGQIGNSYEIKLIVVKLFLEQELLLQEEEMWMPGCLEQFQWLLRRPWMLLWLMVLLIPETETSVRGE